MSNNATYVFPEFSNAGTKWGPTDFYDHVRAALADAFASGLDFETHWLGCKKEILSSRVTRVGNLVTVEVSVSDDLDTPGMGRVSFGVTSRTTSDKFFERIESAGADAHQAAEEEQRGNRGYRGYRVGRILDGRRDHAWEFTYLVSTDGQDYPAGDNYRRWGWQEAPDTADDFDLTAHPEAIPPDVAAKLAEGMIAGEATVVCGDWQATAWRD